MIDTTQLTADQRSMLNTKLERLFHASRLDRRIDKVIVGHHKLQLGDGVCALAVTVTDDAGLSLTAIKTFCRESDFAAALAQSRAEHLAGLKYAENTTRH